MAAVKRQLEDMQQEVLHDYLKNRNERFKLEMEYLKRIDEIDQEFVEKYAMSRKSFEECGNEDGFHAAISELLEYSDYIKRSKKLTSSEADLTP